MTQYIVFDTETILDHDRVLRCTGYDLAVPADRAMFEKETGQVSARFHRPILMYAMLFNDELQLLKREVISDVSKKRFIEKAAYIMHAAISGDDTYLVGFNCEHFDIPVIEVAASEEEVFIPGLYVHKAKPWEDMRSSRGPVVIDLYQEFAGIGRIGGTLDFWSKLIGLPGKQSVSGPDVERLYLSGQINDLMSYVTCDVFNTFGLLVEYLRRSNGIRFSPKRETRRLATRLEQMSPTPYEQSVIDIFKAVV